jgi:hypothetical protein
LNTAEDKNQQHFHILSLSGGGYKGLYTATILEGLEADLGYPIAKKFDLLAGTSIGGILTIALALEIPVTKIKHIFTQNGKSIFRRHSDPIGFLSNGYLCYSKYTNKGLIDCLIKLFGDKKIGDLKHPIIIPTINYTTGTPQILKTRHHENFKRDYHWKLVDAAMATSAAPYYFPFHKSGEGKFIDGGFVANHPGLFACVEAMKYMNISIENIYQLHIGTLSQKIAAPIGLTSIRSGLSQWQFGKKIIDMIFSCQEQSTSQIVEFLLAERYCSINKTIDEKHTNKIGIDRTSNQSREFLVENASNDLKFFLGTKFYNSIKNHDAPIFIPIPVEKGE